MAIARLKCNHNDHSSHIDYIPHLGRGGRPRVLVILGVELARRRHQHLQLLLRPNARGQQDLGGREHEIRVL